MDDKTRKPGTHGAHRQNSVFAMNRGADAVPNTIVEGVLELLEKDENWMRVYRKIKAKYPLNPENLPFPGPNGDYKTGMVIVGGGCADLDEIKDKFHFYAENIGVACEFATDVDLVSAAVALELWSSVFYMDVWQGALKCAGIEGPDAMNSASAILARAFGHGLPCMPIDPDFPDVNFESKILFSAAGMCKEFSDRTIGKDAWSRVTSNVVSDLGYRAQGKSRTHNASLLLGMCLPGMH